VSTFTVLCDLPPLTVVPCGKCDGRGDDDDPAPIGCLTCGGTGEVEVCAGCGAVPAVVNGVERCHCAVEFRRAA